jgi:hypothetical protein
VLVPQSTTESRRDARDERPDQKCQRGIRSGGCALSGLVRGRLRLHARRINRLSECIDAFLGFIGRHSRLGRHELGQVRPIQRQSAVGQRVLEL